MVPFSSVRLGGATASSVAGGGGGGLVIGMRGGAAGGGGVGSTGAAFVSALRPSTPLFAAPALGSGRREEASMGHPNALPVTDMQSP